MGKKKGKKKKAEGVKRGFRAAYLVDMENVGVAGFDGVASPSVKEGDEVYGFFSKNVKMKAETFERMKEAFDSKASVTLLPVDVGTTVAQKNALDFCLSGWVGWLAASGVSVIIIVSKDTGYDPMAKFWNERGFRVVRFVTVRGAAIAVNALRAKAEEEEATEAKDAKPKKEKKKKKKDRERVDAEEAPSGKADFDGVSVETAAEAAVSEVAADAVDPAVDEVERIANEEESVRIFKDRIAVAMRPYAGTAKTAEELAEIVSGNVTDKVAISGRMNAVLKDTAKAGAAYRSVKPLIEAEATRRLAAANGDGDVRRATAFGRLSHVNSDESRRRLSEALTKCRTEAEARKLVNDWFGPGSAGAARTMLALKPVMEKILDQGQPAREEKEAQGKAERRKEGAGTAQASDKAQTGPDPKFAEAIERAIRLTVTHPKKRKTLAWTLASAKTAQEANDALAAMNYGAARRTAVMVDVLPLFEKTKATKEKAKAEKGSEAESAVAGASGDAPVGAAVATARGTYGVTATEDTESTEGAETRPATEDAEAAPAENGAEADDGTGTDANPEAPGNGVDWKLVSRVAFTECGDRKASLVIAEIASMAKSKMSVYAKMASTFRKPEWDWDGARISAVYKAVSGSLDPLPGKA